MIKRQMYSTEEAAKLLGVRPNTMWHSLSMRGHYLGLRPVRMPNRYLRWDAETVNKLAQGVQV